MKELLRLCRLPNALTAAADVVVGAAWAGQAWASWPVAAAAGGSVFLYAGAVAANDVRDSEFDRTWHPERPLPRGTVRRTVARTAAAFLLLLGLASAFAGGPLHLVVTGALFAAILADLLLPKAMARARATTVALCRGLNVMRGGSLHGTVAALALGPAVVHFLWTWLVSIVSETEEKPPARGHRALGVMFLVATAAAPIASIDPDAPLLLMVAIGLGALLGAFIAAPILGGDPAPGTTVRRAVWAFPLLGALHLVARGAWAPAALAVLLYALARVAASLLRQRTA